MSTFHDGPAHGVQLSFARTPILLRVVMNAKGQWDVLDQPEDTPGDDETIHVYRLMSEPMRGFWDGKDKQGRRTGGVFSICQYLYYNRQPLDHQCRETNAWRAWVDEEAQIGHLSGWPENDPK